MTDRNQPVEVSRRIEAPAALIFEILADPQRHSEFDGSEMLREPSSTVHFRCRRDVHHEDAPARSRLPHAQLCGGVRARSPHLLETGSGDLETAGDDPAKVGIPSGLSLGYILTPDGDHATVVTEVFDCGPDENRWILREEGGKWINGTNSVASPWRRP